MKYKVVLTDYYYPNLNEEKKVFEDTDIVIVDCNGKCKTEEDVIKYTKDADAIITQFVLITKKVIDNLLVVEKTKEVVLKCKQNKFAVGTFADDVETAKSWVSLGVQYMSFSVDVGILYEISKTIVSKLKY